MSVLSRIASLQGRRDETPDRELARDLAASRDREGIREIADNLWNRDVRVQFDCIKVLYEVGYLDPGLVAEYTGEFLKLLRSRHNRLVWGGMLALSTVAALKAGEIYPQREQIVRALKSGSVIAVDNAVKTLALVAAQSPQYNREIFPRLLDHLASCRPRSIPQYAESTLAAVDAENKAGFVQVLERRLDDLRGPQLTRVRRVIREAGKR